METIAEAEESEIETSAVPDDSEKVELACHPDLSGSNLRDDSNTFTNYEVMEEVNHDVVDQIEDLEDEEKLKQKQETRKKVENEKNESHHFFETEQIEVDRYSRSVREDSMPPIDLDSDAETGVFSAGSNRSPDRGGGISESTRGKKRLIEIAVEENDYESMEDDESSCVDGAASNIQIPLISSRVDTGVDLAYNPDENVASSPAKSASVGRNTKLKFVDVESSRHSSDVEDDVLFDDKDLEIQDDVTTFQDDVTFHDEVTPRDDVTTHADDIIFNEDDVISFNDDVNVSDSVKKAQDGDEESSPKTNYSPNRARTMMLSVAALKDLKRRARQHRNEEEMMREHENRDKYLRNADNLRRAHEAMRENFMDLLVEKVDKDREQIRQRSAKWDEKRKLAEENLQKERRSRVPKKTKVEVSHDQDFLDRVPKSRIYQVLRLREEWKKEGKLKTQSDDVVFWERIKSGKNPVDEEIRRQKTARTRQLQREILGNWQRQAFINNPEKAFLALKDKIQARKMAASAGSQGQSTSPTKTVSDSQGEEPTPGANLLLRLMEGKSKKEIPSVQEPPKTAPAKPKEEIANQLPNLLGVPQFTKRRRSTAKSEPDPILQLFKRPEMPKLKSLENHFEDTWSKEQQEIMEKRQRLQRAEERKKNMKRTQIMYQNAITHMAMTNRLMARGFEEITEGSNIRDLVQQDEFNPSEIAIPKSPQPRAEPISYPLFTQSKLIPIDIKPEKSYLDKQYDKPSSTKRVDRRRVKQPAAADFQPFQQEQQSSAALSLNSILPTSVVRQPNWHRGMWSNYNLIGVTNPDQQSQKWERNKSIFGEELANSTLLA